MEKFGYCKYCGQAHLVVISGEAEQEVFDDGAAAMCDCDGAKHAKAIDAAKARMENVLGPECTDMGFMLVSEDVYKTALDLFALMLSMQIDAFTVQLPDSALAVKPSSDGFKVTRKRSVVIHG